MARTLKLTREQLARFLPDAESIKQFEKLFSVVDEINIDVVAEAATLAGNADNKAIQALGLIAAISQEIYVNNASSDAKINEYLGLITSIAQNMAVDIAIADRKSTEAIDASNSALRKAKFNGVLTWLTI